MRLLLTLFAFMLIAMPQAHADNDRITTSEIYNLVQDMNLALNNPDTRVGRQFLNQHISDNALFSHNMSVYQQAHPYSYVWHNNPAYSAYYRYPLNPYFSASGAMSLSKWQEIRYFEDKKRLIAGFQTEINVTNINMRPYANTAVVDVAIREHSIGYAPYNPGLTSQIVHSNSRCKMYLGRSAHHTIYVTRMDCNTNTNLPI